MTATAPPVDTPMGLIAGQGSLPLATAVGMRHAGKRVACVGLADQYDKMLPGLCDYFASAGIIRLGRWIKLLRRWGVCEAVMVGRIDKARMYEPMRIIRQMPDWRAAKLWYCTLRHDRRNDALLGAVADTLQQAGITLIDSTQYIPQHMVDPGLITKTPVPGPAQGDIDFALAIVRQMGKLDIGQSIAVRDREIIAVEAIEGTDAMIDRAGQLCRGGKWTLVKVAKPCQDKRFDVPTVGLNTIKKMRQAGAWCLAVEAGQVILLDKPDVIAEADLQGIAIVGIT